MNECEHDLLYYRIYNYYTKFPKLIFLMIPVIIFSLFTRNDILVGLSLGISFGTIIHYFFFIRVVYTTPMFDSLGHPTKEIDRIKEVFE